MLVRHFVDALGPGGLAPSEELVRALEGRAWPGNVRELRNAVERALAMMGPGAEGTPTEPEGDVRHAMASLFGLPIKQATERWTASFERAYVEHALRSAGGSVTGAARLAGVNRRYIQRLMKRHDMRADDGDDGG